jgi:ACR3 family arsenite efflux pump ArsB
MKERIKKKFFSLLFGEAFALVMFAVLWFWYGSYFQWTIPYTTTLPTVYAFLILEFILAQGSLYWYLKWRGLQKGKRDNKLSSGQLSLFVKLKYINLALLGVGIIIYGIWGTSYPQSYHWFFLFLYSFALLEYINYYYVRLSYQSLEEIREFIRQRGFRKSILAREITGSRTDAGKGSLD